MKKTLTLIFCLILFYSAMGETITYKVTSSDVVDSLIIKKVWLRTYNEPVIKVSGFTTGNLDTGAAPRANEIKPSFKLGMEQKKPFALIYIPAYIYSAGKVDPLTSITIDIIENSAAKTQSAYRIADKSSPFSSGEWYKVAVPGEGAWKIDYAYIATNFKIDPSKITPGMIRVFGNGGQMLPESNATPGRKTTEEAAIFVEDGGDGKFDQGDYFIFYSPGHISWAVDIATQTFTHTGNIYDSSSYYFINFNQSPGKRIQLQAPGLQPNVTVSDYADRVVHEVDLYNPGKADKTWWGEDFGEEGGRSKTRSFDFDMSNASNALFTIKLGSRCPADINTFEVKINNEKKPDVILSPSDRNEDDVPVSTAIVSHAITTPGEKSTVELTYHAGLASGIGYLDYLEVNAVKRLLLNPAALCFRNLKAVNPGNIANYRLDNANAFTQVWDATDPLSCIGMNGALAGTTFSFNQVAGNLHEFVAFDTRAVKSPYYVGKIDNQELLSTSTVDYIIVCHPDFLPAANKLAGFHRQNDRMNVVVATTNQVYNEFSSGSQDISAIRNFARMYYENAGTDSTKFPKYLLLLGDASYDYKNRILNNTNFVPTYESGNTGGAIAGFMCDDFFGFLDDNEDINEGIINTLDIGVGRLPVKTTQEADEVVDKIILYKSPSSLGPWRTMATFISDNEKSPPPDTSFDPAVRLDDAEAMVKTLLNAQHFYNETKVYEDAMKFVSTPAGYRIPDANKIINDQVFKGTFLVNYNGHGNISVFSHERILTQDDYSKWRNIDKLPLMITATCDFGRFDRPDYVSAGEQLVLKKDGGAIAALTTTQLVYPDDNFIIDRDFIAAQFARINGRWNTFGDALRISKNATYSHSKNTLNFRKFVLFADPALTPDFPEYFLHTEALMDGTTLEDTDSIGALGEYILKGNVTDRQDNILEWFSGNVFITLYDKPHLVTTVTGSNKQFEVNTNVIFKGRAEIKNGHFQVSFVVPKDIDYEYGKGSISLYGHNNVTDGAGRDTTKTIGGFSDNPQIESDPPIVRPYISDSLFQNGGLTGANTMLFVILEDATGINISGNTVGHDLTAVLDGDVSSPFILNDYYEAAPNTYKRGYVNFPLTNLADGMHHITVKAWDANNNSGTGTVYFEVANGSILRIKQLTSYPNPFNDVTHLRFEHNHPNEAMTAELRIYSSSGSEVKTIKTDIINAGSHCADITWDGSTDAGTKASPGLYLYKLRLFLSNTIEDFGYGKVIRTD